MKLRTHRRATWLALFGVLLYALWPLLATAQPRGNSEPYDLCPHASLHRLAQETHHEVPSSNPIWTDSHQLKCTFSTGMGDGSSPMPETTPMPSLAAHQTAQAALSVDGPRFTLHFYATAPRGPPATLF